MLGSSSFRCVVRSALPPLSLRFALVGGAALLASCMPEHSLSSYRAGSGSSATRAPTPQAEPADAGAARADVELPVSEARDAAIALAADSGVSVATSCSAGCVCERASDVAFMFCATLVTRDEAARRCSAASRALVSIDDERRDVWLRERMLAVAAADAFWLGGSDAQQEGVWRWEDGRVFFDQTRDAANQATFAPWDVDQPNDVMGEDCALSSANGWRDLDCGEELAFACQG